MSATGLFSIDLLCYADGVQGPENPEGMPTGCRARYAITWPKEQTSYEAVAAANVTCPDCGHKLKRVPSSSNLMKRAYPDGHKREGWFEAKLSADLEVDIANTSDENEKRRLRGEIRRMGIAPQSDNNPLK